LTLVLSGMIFFNGENALIDEAIASNNPSVLLKNTRRKQIEEAITDVKPPAITEKSSPEALRIAKELKKLNAKFYGAFWCSHCYDQKQALGKEAMAMIPYVECDKDGHNSQRKLCKEKKIPGYPSWEINGEIYPGEQKLSELNDLIELANLEKDEAKR